MTFERVTCNQTVSVLPFAKDNTEMLALYCEEILLRFAEANTPGAHYTSRPRAKELAQKISSLVNS